jgi:ABC-type multidrug transport system ATPase subunit
VSKTHANGVQPLEDVTLTIPSGMYGLLGPNGASFRSMWVLPHFC